MKQMFLPLLILFLLDKWNCSPNFIFQLQADFSCGRTKVILTSMIYSLNINKAEKKQSIW